MTTLLLSSRHTADDQALWRAAVARGWRVERVRGVQLPSLDDENEIVIYAEAFFAPAIAAKLGRRLLDPSEEWLAKLPYEYAQRRIRVSTLEESRSITEPSFIKPPNDKSFPARVHTSGDTLPAEFDPTMAVLVAEPVQWRDEFRCFLLDGQVRAVSPYLRDGKLAKYDDYRATDVELQTAAEFATRVAADPRSATPRAVAMDVGVIEGRGWAVVEANGAWGSGIYGCDGSAVLDVLRVAIIQPG